METRGNDGPSGQSLNSEINITPLVDVMLVVLIIFMVVAPMLQKGVDVDLPPARNVVDASEDENRTLTVVLQDGGRMFLGTDPLDPVDLADALRTRRKGDPYLRFQVKADRDVAYGEIKRILQVAREAGFRGAALIAREIDAGGAQARPAQSRVAAGD